MEVIESFPSTFNSWNSSAEVRMKAGKKPGQKERDLEKVGKVGRGSREKKGQAERRGRKERKNIRHTAQGSVSELTALLLV